MNLPFLTTPQGEDPVILEAVFSTNVERLFQAWTTPEDIKQWFGADEGGPEHVSMQVEVGGTWEFVFSENEGKVDSLSGEYLRIEKDTLLEFTWVHTRTLADGSSEQSPESLVSVAFEERPSGAFSRLVHKSVISDSSRSNIGGGWSSSFTKLKALTE